MRRQGQLGTREIQIQYKENLCDVYKGCQTVEQDMCRGCGIPFLRHAQTKKQRRPKQQSQTNIDVIFLQSSFSFV